MLNKYLFKDCMEVDIQDKNFSQNKICLQKKQNSDNNFLCFCMEAILT